jgi:hypothetical protein
MPGRRFGGKFLHPCVADKSQVGACFGRPPRKRQKRPGRELVPDRVEAGAGPKGLQAATARRPGWQKEEVAMWVPVLTLIVVTPVLVLELAFIARA